MKYCFQNSEDTLTHNIPKGKQRNTYTMHFILNLTLTPKGDDHKGHFRCGCCSLPNIVFPWIDEIVQIDAANIELYISQIYNIPSLLYYAWFHLLKQHILSSFIVDALNCISYRSCVIYVSGVWRCHIHDNGTCEYIQLCHFKIIKIIIELMCHCCVWFSCLCQCFIGSICIHSAVHEDSFSFGSKCLIMWMEIKWIPPPNILMLADLN
jgi:hypothetical protein